MNSGPILLCNFAHVGQNSDYADGIPRKTVNFLKSDNSRSVASDLDVIVLLCRPRERMQCKQVIASQFQEAFQDALRSCLFVYWSLNGDKHEFLFD